MVKPPRSSMPCTPMNSRSTCIERTAASATGPTSASEGVRRPPVSTIERSVRPLWRITSATGTEFVTTVRLGTSRR